MTPQEYEQKKRECWKRYKRDNWESLANVQEAFNYAFDRAYALGKQERDAEVDVISGWVARDSDGDLFFYNDKPRREKAVWDEPQYWIGETQIDLDPDLFPDLTWNDEPEPIEIIIKRKKNE